MLVQTLLYMLLLVYSYNGWMPERHYVDSLSLTKLHATVHSQSVLGVQKLACRKINRKVSEESWDDYVSTSTFKRLGRRFLSIC
jgi:hypothetical protein